MSKTIVTVINQKGGVGKSTTSASLACNIVRLLPAASVLLIDGDPQGDLATLLKLKFNVEPVTTNDVLLRPNGPIWPSYGIGMQGRLSFTPSSFDLDNIESEIRKSGDNLFECVRRKLSGAAAEYVIIDCSPSFRDLNKAFIAASDYVIIPTLPEPLSLPSVQRTALLVKMMADAAERERVYPGVSQYRRSLELGPDEAMQTVLRGSVRELRKNGKRVHPASERALDYFRRAGAES